MADIHAKLMATLKREQVGSKIQQFDDSKVKNHWRRNKKATVDLMEMPVAIDRQLEDQRIQSEFNRNPRANIPTKVDKVRSEQIIAKKGSSRDVGIKANVVNKFVREASGIHTYTLVPPPRRKGEVIPIDADPETNPFVKTYAKETKKKPVIVSFGHRPSSASRTFNPGTMKIRMKHNEFAKAPKEGKFEFGLSVGILGKLLNAPKIDAPGAHNGNSSNNDDIDGIIDVDYDQPHNSDPHGLFTSPPQSPTAISHHNSDSNARQLQASGAGGVNVGFSFSPENTNNGYGGMDMTDNSQGDFNTATSWVSGNDSQTNTNTLNNKGKSSTFFEGGIGNIDYLDIRVPGFPQGGEVKGKKKKKKDTRKPNQLTPVSLFPFSDPVPNSLC
jgi:hypothetical protein